MDIQGIGGLLHPIRMQILKVLAKDKELTTRGLAARMPDVPQASLYRHLRVMLKDGILEVSQEKQVRGTIERSYRLRINPFDEIAARMKRLDKKELLDLFTSFMLAELTDFAEYLGDDDHPVEQERLGFASNSLYLNDAELKEFVTAMTSVIKDHSHTEAGPGRRLHKFSFTVIPARSGL